MSRFFAQRLTTLSPYTPGEQPQGRVFTKLNTNEMPYPPSALVTKAVCGQADKLNLYSDPTCRQAIEPLAKTFGVQPDEVFVGNGSDEILSFCFAGLCPNGVAFADITYGFYPVLAGLFGMSPTLLPLQEDFTQCPENYAQLYRTIFIANPNAPTGLAFTRAEIEKILHWNPENLVVVDEAYVDFGAESAVPLVQKYDNLMVVGTFSKSRAMAGARLGYAVANRELIADLNRIKYSFNPYNVNRMTLAAVEAVLQDTAYFEECCTKIIETRAKTLAVLQGLGFETTQSLANFVFVRHPSFSGEELYHRLRERGILVRQWNLPRINDHLRISIGTPQEMELLFAALREILPA